MKSSKTKTSSKTAEKDTPKKISKTWLAALANKGSGKIIDMRAVLK